MVNAAKIEQVQTLTETIRASPVVGLVDVQYLPAPQLQNMRSSLRSQGVQIIMLRKRLLHRALDASNKDNINALTAKMRGMPALLFSSSNPFALYKTIQKSKSEAPAKPGQTAPKDIVVKAGPTQFAPGPIISELASVGIKTKVDAGKLVVMQDTVIVKEGQPISQKVAETLKRLDIKPMEIGLNIVAVWENGTVFEAKQLHLDEAEFARNIQQAVQWSMSLAIEIAYPTDATMELLLQKAFRDAKALALEQEILTDLTAGELLEKAERQALSVKEAGNVPVPERSEKQTEAPAPEEKQAKAPVSQKKAVETAATQEKRAEAPPLPEKRISEEALSENSPFLPDFPGGRPDLKGKPHPKQGRVTEEEAASLLSELQKKGTLRGG